ncbi:4Fe-4S dicluster domain-containing protein [Desulfofalx alkaliphila]|uniref:4Fe-4S dicluster domain-containing protein n=1 Tax=Desulfofalx alkaliphila TaxID=105483 RepID=UPI0005538C85|nr:4Fe-4S dicluster domain-containing protein [Desulfofalx alkaliphila]
MKKLDKKEELCTACHLCEQICSRTYFKEENPKKSAIRIEEQPNIKITVCSQCGECIDLCPAQAIYRDKKGVVRIRKAICAGCFACVGFCPEGAMYHQGELEEPFKCIACGICAKECPTGAIFVEGEAT